MFSQLIEADLKTSSQFTHTNVTVGSNAHPEFSGGLGQSLLFAQEAAIRDFHDQQVSGTVRSANLTYSDTNSYLS
jgi:hypothetical protein